MSFDLLIRRGTVVGAGEQHRLDTRLPHGAASSGSQTLLTVLVSEGHLARGARTLVRGRTVFADGRIVGPLEVGS